MTVSMPPETCSTIQLGTPWTEPGHSGTGHSREGARAPPVMAHGDPRASRGVMDVYRRLTVVVEKGRGRGQGHGLSDG